MEGASMTFSEFEIHLFLALVEACNASNQGQCEAYSIAQTIFPAAKSQWIVHAVNNFENKGWLGSVALRHRRIILMISDEGWQAADCIQVYMAEAQRPRPMMGFLPPSNDNEEAQ